MQDQESAKQVSADKSSIIWLLASNLEEKHWQQFVHDDAAGGIRACRYCKLIAMARTPGDHSDMADELIAAYRDLEDDHAMRSDPIGRTEDEWGFDYREIMVMLYGSDVTIYGASIPMSVDGEWLLVEENKTEDEPPHRLSWHASPQDACAFNLYEAGSWCPVALWNRLTRQWHPEGAIENTVSTYLPPPPRAR